MNCTVFQFCGVILLNLILVKGQQEYLVWSSTRFHENGLIRDSPNKIEMAIIMGLEVNNLQRKTEEVVVVELIG